jgi:hypothetical protein
MQTAVYLDLFAFPNSGIKRKQQIQMTLIVDVGINLQNCCTNMAINTMKDLTRRAVWKQMK